MRTLFALAAVLSLTSALIIPYDGTAASHDNRLDPRMGGRNPGGGGGGGGGGKKGKDYGSPYANPRGGMHHPGRGATSRQVRDAIAQEPGYTRGWDPVMPHRPAPGESGVWVDHRNRRIEVHYGDDMPYHGDGELYHEQAYPASAGRGYVPASRTESRDQRRRALNGLPAGYGPWIHRDENRGASVKWMDNGLTRTSRYGYDRSREDSTNVPVPEGESARQSRMFAEARILAETVHPGYEMVYYDNRLNTASFRVQPNRGPHLGKDNDGRGYPYHTTNQNSGYRRKAKRDINQIANINSQISDQSTTTTDLQQQYELNMLAYQTVSANATELLFPVIDQILASSNLTIIHDMAFSLLQIVGAPQSTVGPFMYGTTNFGWSEN